MYIYINPKPYTLNPVMVPTENRNCLSLPVKEGFFASIPTEERESLGAMGWLRIIKDLLDI